MMLSAKNAESRLYRKEIDGLRAFAVTAVIINHFNKELLPGGYLGVDIFFVISGYVITSSLYARQSLDFKEFISGFYARRIKRIIPALVFFVLPMSIAICMFNPAPVVSILTGATSLIGLSNIYLLKYSTDYFAQATELNIFTHTWSLGVEEQFYFLFPFLIWFSGFGRKTKNGAKNLFLIIGTLTTISLIGFIYLYPTNQPAAYFLMPARFWEMATGCLIFVAFQKRKSFEQNLQRVPPILVLALIVGVMYLPMSFAAISTISVVVLSSLMIAALKSHTWLFKIFTKPIIVNIGLISYSLYLWHWGVLSLSRWTIGIHWWTVPFQVFIMLGLALASYRLIEKPFRKWNWFGNQWTTLIIGGGVAASLFLFIFKVLQPIRKELYVGSKQNIGLEQSGTDTLLTPYKIEGHPGMWNGSDCVLQSNSDIKKRFDSFKCTLGDSNEAIKRILVVGNSYSASFVQAFDELIIKDGYAVTLTSSWGASPMPGIPNSSQWSKANEHYWEVLVPSLISGLKAGDIVFAINDVANYSPKYGKSRKLKNLSEGILRLSRDLSKKGVDLAFMHGLPFARDAECKPEDLIPQWFQKLNSSERCLIPNREQTILRRINLDEILTNLQSSENLLIVDLMDIFCPEVECSYYGKNNTILYRDSASHPSVEAARLSGPYIRRIFIDQLP